MNLDVAPQVGHGRRTVTVFQSFLRAPSGDSIERDRSIATLQNERDRWKLKHDEKEIDRLRLEVELLRLKKWYYGRKADQLTSQQDVAQMLLEFGQQLENRPVDLEDVPADVNLGSVEVKTVRRVKRGRRNLGGI